MGCGASKVTPQSGEDTKPLNTSAKTIDHDVRPNGHANGNIPHRPKSSNDKEGKVSKTVEESKAVHNGGIHLNSPENKDVFNKQSFDKQADDTVTAENGESYLTGLKFKNLEPIYKMHSFVIKLLPLLHRFDHHAFLITLISKCSNNRYISLDPWRVIISSLLK